MPVAAASQHRSVRLRPWQKRALDALAASPHPDFLAMATPGAGKTTFALTAAVLDLAAAPHRRVVVVAPTQHLKVQWARNAAVFGLHLEPEWSARSGRLPADMHGVVVTYQQVAANPEALAPLARDAFVVLDEVHHAGDERAWGEGISTAFGGSARRLMISGTPFRSDTAAIPFVRYEHEEAVADFSYGYDDALADGGVVRPVFFPRVDGQMEWTAPDGTHRSHTFADRLGTVAANQRLRTALSLEGEWLPAVLVAAHERLRRVRQRQPDAGGLVIAMDQDHARGIADLLVDRLGVRPVVATSDDPAASANIARFADGREPWIVAVRMVSEGVDIPRLRVGVFATNTTTELFFRQAVGRLVRWTRGQGAQAAHLFIPDDVRLRTYAAQIAEVRRHSLRRRDDPDADGALAERAPAPADPPPAREQLSLFAAISAVPLGAPAELDEDGLPAHEPDPDPALELVLAAPVPPASAHGRDGGEGPTMTRQERKKLLRSGNADRARLIAQLSNRTHAQVNAELNRLARITTIGEATVEQLQVRLEAADRWLAGL